MTDTVWSKTLATWAKSYNSKITKGSRSSLQKNLETITNKYDKYLKNDMYLHKKRQLLENY